MCEYCHKAPFEVATPLGWLCVACNERTADLQREELTRRFQSRMAYYRRLSEMGERFTDRTFANYRVTPANAKAYEAALKVADDREHGLYLYGGPGNGKTHLGAAIVNAFIELHVPAIFTTEGGLVSRIRETYTKNGALREGERDILKHYATAPVLVLDDLGTEPFTPNTARLFYALINQRYEANLPLIATANVSLADLAGQWQNAGVDVHIGAKLCDRIREMVGVVIRLTAPSERGVPA